MYCHYNHMCGSGGGGGGGGPSRPLQHCLQPTVGNKRPCSKTLYQ